MRIVPVMLLLAGGVLIVLPIVADDEPRAENAKVANAKAFPTAEHDGIVVTLLEESLSRSPDRKSVVTSFLFMVENRNENPGRHSQGSPMRIFSSEGKLYHDATNGLPKTGTGILKYSQRNLPHFDNLPEPLAGSKTLLIRHWIHDALPETAVAVEADFGQNEQYRTFRFPLQRR